MSRSETVARLPGESGSNFEAVVRTVKTHPGPWEVRAPAAALALAVAAGCIEPTPWRVEPEGPVDLISAVEIDSDGEPVDAAPFAPFELPVPIRGNGVQRGRLWVVGYRTSTAASAPWPRLGERPRSADPFETALAAPTLSLWVENGRHGTAEPPDLPRLTTDRVADICPADADPGVWIAECGPAVLVSSAVREGGPCGFRVRFLPEGNWDEEVASPVQGGRLPVRELSVEGNVDAFGQARITEVSNPGACTIRKGRSIPPRVLSFRRPDDPPIDSPAVSCQLDAYSRSYAGRLLDVMDDPPHVWGIRAAPEPASTRLSCRSDRPVRPACLVRARWDGRSPPVERCDGNFDRIIPLPGTSDAIGVLAVRYEPDRPPESGDIDTQSWRVRVLDRNSLEDRSVVPDPAGFDGWRRSWVRSRGASAVGDRTFLVFRSFRSIQSLELWLDPMEEFQWRIAFLQDEIFDSLEYPSNIIPEKGGFVVPKIGYNRSWLRCRLNGVPSCEAEEFLEGPQIYIGSQVLHQVRLEPPAVSFDGWTAGIEGALLVEDRGTTRAIRTFVAGDQAAPTAAQVIPPLGRCERGVVAVALVGQDASPVRHRSVVGFLRGDGRFDSLVLVAGAGWIADLAWTGNHLVARDVLTERALRWSASDLARGLGCAL